MDADAETHRLAGRVTLVFFFNGVLDRDGAFDGIDRTCKIGDKTVAGGIEDPAAMGGDQSIEDGPVGLQPAQRADLVQPHQPAVLGNVGREDHGELSFDYLDFCHRPSSRGADAANRIIAQTNIAIIPALFDGGVVVPVHLTEIWASAGPSPVSLRSLPSPPVRERGYTTHSALSSSPAPRERGGPSPTGLVGKGSAASSSCNH